MAKAMAQLLVSQHVDRAEQQLQEGQWQLAGTLASKALCFHPAAAELARAFYCLLQADFQQKRLTDLPAAAQDASKQLRDLPVGVMLLWGIIALELGEAHQARIVLGEYASGVAAGGGQQLSEEDALALARLYAVRTLAEGCSDAAGALGWVRSGRLRLSPGHQELLVQEITQNSGPDQLRAAAAAAAGGAHGSPRHANHSSSSSSCCQQSAHAGAQGFVDSDFCTLLGELPEQEEGPSTSSWWQGQQQQQQSLSRTAASSSWSSKQQAGTSSSMEQEITAADDLDARAQQQQGFQFFDRAKNMAAAGSSYVQQLAQEGWQVTSEVLHLQDTPPWQVAAGAAAAALVAASLYRERKTIKRALGRLGQGIGATAAMAVGFSAPNAMAAVPSGAYSSSGQGWTGGR